MSVLRTLESKLTNLIEGTFSRAFRSEVRPVEIARKLAREMEEHKSTTLTRTFVPNEYRVFLSPRDRERFEGYEDALGEELSGYLLEHARREGLTLPARPRIDFETDGRLGLGEFGIQTGIVMPEGGEHEEEPEQSYEEPAEPAQQSGRTMVYSNAGRLTGPLEEQGQTRSPTALLLVDGRRMLIGPGGATIGRSRQCDITLEDPNISRQHAEVRPRGGSWILTDLGSTNGSRLNGHPVERSEVVRPGDEIELGATIMRFELE
jgi:hypothetical protein